MITLSSRATLRLLDSLGENHDFEVLRWRSGLRLRLEKIVEQVIYHYNKKCRYDYQHYRDVTTLSRSFLEMFDDEDLDIVADETNPSYSNFDVEGNCQSCSFSSISSILPLLSSTPRDITASAVEDESECLTYIPSPDVSLISNDYNVNISSSIACCEPTPTSVSAGQSIMSCRPTVPEILSAWCGFTLVGDNIDKTVRRRHQLMDRTTQSLHYFNSYAVRDRVDFSSLDDKCLDMSVDNITVPATIAGRYATYTVQF